MAVDNISPTAAVSYAQQQQAAQARQSVLPASDENQVGADQPVRDQVQLKHPTASKNLETVRAIEQMHARLNEEAKGVRETNEVLAQAAEKTDQMRANLQAILKNFPPFPTDSSRRQEILMSYISLKKEMEQLMVPPPPAPIYESVKHMWDSLFAENGQMLATAVPKLDKTSSDKEIRNAAIGLDKTSSHLATLSTDMTNALIKGR